MKLKLCNLFPAGLLGLILIGCNEKYKWTTGLCENRFFVERFNVNPAGVDVHYLTDSSTFRMYVGRFDNEHENFSYSCVGDSIVIVRLAADSSGIRREVGRNTYSIAALKIEYPIK
ncbi:hypothetical protein HB364_02370 [Pseudoflavitalea sp. X16]|uniref:hypothetical protein n=1 Tax=Paraflavitalea devenefica TaxID=2716334 RepID=UPI0014203D20|nr:hypothetical protein [Paraflavitalea devenefica]NII23908.1 hypothetical protein [Paraflavitalea devenefica]